MDRDEPRHLIFASRSSVRGFSLLSLRICCRCSRVSENRDRERISRSWFSPERFLRLIQFYRLVRQGGRAPVSDDLSFAQLAKDYIPVWTAGEARMRS